MRYLLKIILFLNFSLLANRSFSQKGNYAKADVYMTPRNVNYGWYDNGVFQFKLERKSIKVPYAKKTYATDIVKDSVYELFYLRSNFPLEVTKNLKPDTSSKGFPVRIIIAFGRDTLFVNSQNVLIWNQRCYQVSTELSKIIESMMPLEMIQNWRRDFITAKPSN